MAFNFKRNAKVTLTTMCKRFFESVHELDTLSTWLNDSK
jgi:hypothetical protein